MDCIDLTFKTIKKVELRRKTTKVIKLQWIASIWLQNDQKSWVTSQNIQNNAKLQNWSNNNELHWFDVKMNKTFELGWQNYKRNQITMDLHRFDIKTIKKCWVTSQNIQNNAKLRKWSNNNGLHRFNVKTIKTFELGGKTTKVIILRWNCNDLTRQNDQNFWVTSQNYKRRSNYN